MQAKIRERLTDDLIRAVEFNVCSDRSVKEGVRNGRHYIISNHTHFDAGRAFEYRFAREMMKGDDGKQKFAESNSGLLGEARKLFKFANHKSTNNENEK
jgi:hypothetical protein